MSDEKTATVDESTSGGTNPTVSAAATTTTAATQPTTDATESSPTAAPSMIAGFQEYQRQKRAEEDAISLKQAKEEAEKKDNFLRQTGATDDSGRAMLALFAIFFQFLTGGNGKLSDNGAAKGLLSAFGFNDNDINEVDKIGTRLRNNEIDIVDATNDVFRKIPKSRLSSDQARRVVGDVIKSPNGQEAASVLEQQRAIVATIPLAAEAAGINPENMKAIWGVETNFSRTSLISSSKCEGSWQFSDGTWNGIMRHHGAQIAALIRKNHPGYENVADELEKSVRSGIPRDGTKNRTSGLQYDPVVSTYAAAFLLKENAAEMKVDPKKYSSTVAMYSAYNIGGTAAKKFLSMANNGDSRSASSVLGSVATNNPAYFGGGVTAGTAYKRMASKLGGSRNTYDKLFSGFEEELAQKAGGDAPIVATQTNTQTSVPAYLKKPEEKLAVTSEKPSLLASGKTLQDEHKETMAQGGKVTPDPKQPAPLTTSFTGKGTDEVAKVAQADADTKAAHNTGVTLKVPELLALRT